MVVLLQAKYGSAEAEVPERHSFIQVKRALEIASAARNINGVLLCLKTLMKKAMKLGHDLKYGKLPKA